MIDKAVRPGGAYRVGDRVYDANGKDLGDEAIKELDKIDTDAVETANKEAEKVREQQALTATGGVGAALAQLLGAVNPALRHEMRNVGVTEARAASQDETVKVPGGVVAAELTGKPGPTPVQPRTTVAPRMATDSPADDLDDEADVLAESDKRQEESEEAARLAAEAAGMTPVGAPKKKAAAKKSTSASAPTT